MARFLHVVPPLTGHLRPHVAVAAQLRARGHEVAVAAAPQSRAAIEAAGIPIVPLRRLEQDAAALARHNRGASPLWQVPAWYFARYVSPAWFEAEVDDVSAAVERIEPDVLVYDQWTAGSLLVVPDRFGLHSAVFAIMLFSTRSPDRSLASGVTGGRGPGWPASGAAASLAEVRFWRACMTAVERLQMRHAAAWRARRGLEPLGSRRHELYDRHALYLHSGVPALDRSLDELAANHRYVGPCSLCEEVSEESRRRIEPLLEAASGEAPLVVVSLGTVHAHGGVRRRFLETCVQALASLPVRAVVTTGASSAEDELWQNLPRAENVVIERWLPHAPLLWEASAMVTNGGAGTIGAALSAGVPLVVMPFHSDQAENALRIQQRALGLKIPMLSSPAGIRAALVEVLGDPAYRRNVRRMAGIIRSHGGAKRAAFLLEGIAAGATATRARPLRGGSEDGYREQQAARSEQMGAG